MESIEQQLNNCKTQEERLKLIGELKTYIIDLYDKCYNVNRTNSIKTYLNHSFKTTTAWSNIDAIVELKELIKTFELTYFKINYTELHCINGTLDMDFKLGDTTIESNKVDANSDEYLSFTISNDKDQLITQQDMEWSCNKNEMQQLIDKLKLIHVTVDDMIVLLTKICGVQSNLQISKQVSHV
jgi:hypothetical protein